MTKSFEDIQNEVNAFIEELLEECTPVDSAMVKELSWPLDQRARPYGTMYVGEDCLLVPKKEVKNLDYYGGFEYVDSEYRQEIGDFVMFSTECPRVAKLVDVLKGEEVEETEGEGS